MRAAAGEATASAMYSQRLVPMEAQMITLAAELEAARQETRELQEQVCVNLGRGSIGIRRMGGRYVDV